MIYLVVILLIAGAAHARLTRQRSKTAELLIVYLLVGACGLPFTFIGVRAFISPDYMLHNLAASGSPAIVVAIASFMLGCSAIAILTIWRRDQYLVGPVVGWSIFWAGVTYAHVVLQSSTGGKVTPIFLLNVFANHLVIGILLLVLLVAHRRAARNAAGVAAP